ncbi:hypothetical protein IMX12_13235 [Streptomyces sp. Babs14]|uniref:hypothetical protein n=1 Tax=unclassified Streptomyces TaxID=2593676 RepID=UPI001C24CA57|nr:MULTISPECIES: hypothetical protein [unclassified Streptomyces]MBU8549772.1 hypothetical protein [Streptomyces sp. Osf17]MBU8556555.1 hypothetical protein [Streptomyces sp. Babs14]
MADLSPRAAMPASPETLAELHRQCNADYEQAAANRAAAAGAARDQLALSRAHAAEAVHAR